MNDAMLIETLALTDALLEAGWVQGAYEKRTPYSFGYATRYCLVGALTAAASEIRARYDLPTELGLVEPLVPLLTAAGGLKPELALAALMRFNDNAGSVEPVRDLVQLAAAAIGK